MGFPHPSTASLISLLPIIPSPTQELPTQDKMHFSLKHRLLSSTAFAVCAARIANAAIQWDPCPDAVGFDCAFLDVPMSYDPSNALHAKNVSVALRKRPAKNATAPYILLNFGGPGLSGTKFLVERFYTGTNFIPKQFDGAYNWVSFDPRGKMMLCRSSDRLLIDYSGFSARTT